MDGNAGPQSQLLRKLRQEDCDFKTYLGYLISSRSAQITNTPSLLLVKQKQTIRRWLIFALLLTSITQPKGLALLPTTVSEGPGLVASEAPLFWPWKYLHLWQRNRTLVQKGKVKNTKMLALGCLEGGHQGTSVDILGLPQAYIRWSQNGETTKNNVLNLCACTQNMHTLLKWSGVHHILCVCRTTSSGITHLWDALRQGLFQWFRTQQAVWARRPVSLSLPPQLCLLSICSLSGSAAVFNMGSGIHLSSLCVYKHFTN